MESRIEALEARLDDFQAALSTFGVIDLEVASYMLGGWLALFVLAHGVGRACRALGKV